MLPEMKYQVMAVRRRRKTLQQKYATMHRMFTVVMYVLVCWCYSCSTPLTHAWSPIAVQTIATNLHNQQPALQPEQQQQHQQQFANYPRSQTSKSFKQQTNEISPYVDLVLCPVRAEPWSCARQQSARILDVWESGLHTQWQKFKVEADRELNATLERRGFSGSEVLTKEKPSSILKKIELGTNYLKDSLSKSLDRFWGHETKSEIDQDVVQEKQTDEHNANVNEPNDNNLNDEGDEDEEEEEEEEAAEGYNNDAEHKLDLSVHNNDTTEGEIEFFELNDDGEEVSDDEPNGQLKKPGGGGKRKKNKNKRKKGQHDAQVQPATVLLLQQPAVPEEHHEHGGAGTEEVHVSSGHDEGRPNKFKRKKDRRQKRRKNKHQHNHGGLESSEDDLLSSLLEGHGAPSGLGLLENLDVDDWLVDGGKRKKGYPSKYGRSNGVTRGKKKKKKKALMKLVLLGQFLKAKIELLLKLLGAHLQIKFFAIALIGLLINIARFWIDVKRGAPPQKVVYVEHAHHQHHYEDHGEEWNEPGGYWKRSLHTDTTPEGGSATDSYLPQDDAHYLAYRNSNPQWQ